MANTRQPPSIPVDAFPKLPGSTLDINRALTRLSEKIPQSIPNNDKTLGDITALVMVAAIFRDKVKNRENPIQTLLDSSQKNVDTLGSKRDQSYLERYNALMPDFATLKAEALEKIDRRTHFISLIEDFIREQNLSIAEITKLISRSNTPTAQVKAMIEHQFKRFMDLTRDYKTLRTNERPLEGRLKAFEARSLADVKAVRSLIPTAATQATPTQRNE